MKTSSAQGGPRRLTLRTKMLILFITAFCGIVATVLVSILMFNEARIGGPSYKSIRKDKDAIEILALLESDLLQVNYEVQKITLKTDANSAKNIETTIKNLSNNIELNSSKLLSSLESPQSRVISIKLQNIWMNYKKTMFNDLLPAVRRQQYQNVNFLINGIQSERLNTFSNDVSSLVVLLSKDFQKTEVQVVDDIEKETITAGIVILLAIFLNIFFSYRITTSITRPLRTCVEYANAISEYRLDTHMTVTGEREIEDLAVAMRTMAHNLRDTLSRVKAATKELITFDNNRDKFAHKLTTSVRLQEADVKEFVRVLSHFHPSVSAASEDYDKLTALVSDSSAFILQMASSAEEVFLSADKLGLSVDEVISLISEMTTTIKEISINISDLFKASSITAISIAEMATTIKRVEKNSMETSFITENVSKDAATGKIAVDEAIAGMQTIRSSSRITAEVIENLSLRTNDIGAIISVIDELAEQTSLLALNAAIIAAQAGEHGKGFAVVAEEIRELAERTSSSTREIAIVINGVQAETRRAVNAISQTEISISEGEHRSQHSGHTLEKIVSGVQKANIRILEITRASVELAQASQNIKNAMESVEDIVGHIARSVHEHSNGSDIISKAVERMKELTSNVCTSAREQNRTSNQIAHASGYAASLINEMRNFSKTQVQNIAMLSSSFENIHETAVINCKTATEIENSIDGLSRQIDILEKVMAGFII